MKKKQHAHRTFGEDGAATCECGEEFDSDDAWRVHYEDSHDEAERMRLENRDPAAQEAAQREREKAHAAVAKASEETRGD